MAQGKKVMPSKKKDLKLSTQTTEQPVDDAIQALESELIGREPALMTGQTPPPSAMPQQPDYYDAMTSQLSAAVGSDEPDMGIAAMTMGMSPAYEAAMGQQQSEQEAAAMELAKLTQQRSSKRHMLPAKFIKDLADSGTNVKRLREGSQHIYNWLSSEAFRKTSSTGKRAEGATFWDDIKSFVKSRYNKFRTSLRKKGGDSIELARAHRAYYTQIANYIKTMSGAAVSAQEAERLMMSFPDWGDNPKVFMQMWDDFVSEEEDKYKNQMADLQRGGFSNLSTDYYHHVLQNPYQRLGDNFKSKYTPPKPKAKKKRGPTVSRPEFTELVKKDLDGTATPEELKIIKLNAPFYRRKR